MVAKGRLDRRGKGYIALVASDGQFLLIFGALHLVALALGVVLFVMFLRAEHPHRPFSPPEDDDSGGGGNDRRPDHRPKTSPSGGIPLPDAEPAPLRLRGPGRLADLHRPGRRTVREPARSPSRRPAPRRVPARR
jgi:hypothetical protein